MDVGVGNSLIIFFLIFLVFAFVAFLINMLVSCCEETLGDDAGTCVDDIDESNFGSFNS